MRVLSAQHQLQSAQFEAGISNARDVLAELDLSLPQGNAAAFLASSDRLLLKDAPKPVVRPAAITKIAVGFSAFALVLSTVSLLLATSARQARCASRERPRAATR